MPLSSPASFQHEQPSYIFLSGSSLHSISLNEVGHGVNIFGGSFLPHIRTILSSELVLQGLSQGCEVHRCMIFIHGVLRLALWEPHLHRGHNSPG